MGTAVWTRFVPRLWATVAAQLTQWILLECWGSQAHSSLLCCYFTPWNNFLPPDTRTGDGVSAELINAALCSVPHSHRLCQDPATWQQQCRSGSSQLQLLQPRVGPYRSPKLAQLLPAWAWACPALHGPLWNTGNDNLPVPTATGAGHSFHWTTKTTAILTSLPVLPILLCIEKWIELCFLPSWPDQCSHAAKTTPVPFLQCFG